MTLLPDEVEFARQQALEHAADDPLWAELMGSYAALGELLHGEEPRDEGYAEDCRTLAARLVALGKRIDEEFEQARAAYYARLAVDALGRAA